jgi:hypothetical protein
LLRAVVLARRRMELAESRRRSYQIATTLAARLLRMT